jgi:hypothetical protein
MKLLYVSALSFVSVATTLAQPVVGAKSGVISEIAGKVWLGDKEIEKQAAVFPDVKENVTVRTEEGMVEVLLTPGVVLRLGENSSFKMITNRLIDTRLDMLTGEAVITALDLAKDTNVTFAVKDRTITLNKAGLYHIDLEPARLKVFAGAADVKTEGGTVTVPSGKMILLSSALALAEKFDIKDTDSLDHWSHGRDGLMARSNVSSANRQYQSPTIDPCFGGASARTPGIISHALGSWGYNPYYGLVTYIPCNGSLWSPYGYQYWSPRAAYRAFYAPRPVYRPMPSSGGYNAGYGGPPSMGSTSGGYSGSVAAAASPSMVSAPAAAASSGSSAASSAASSSAGHASGGGGGRGH